MATLPTHILKDIFEMKRQMEKCHIHPNVKYDVMDKLMPHPVATIVKQIYFKI